MQLELLRFKFFGHTGASFDGQVRLPVGLEDGGLDRLPEVAVVGILGEVKLENGLLLNPAAGLRHQPAVETPNSVGVGRVGSRSSEA